MIEVKDKDTEKFLVALTNGEESEYLGTGANLIIDELQIGKRSHKNQNIETIYARINEIAINKQIAFEQ